MLIEELLNIKNIEEKVIISGAMPLSVKEKLDENNIKETPIDKENKNNNNINKNSNIDEISNNSSVEKDSSLVNISYTKPKESNNIGGKSLILQTRYVHKNYRTII